MLRVAGPQNRALTGCQIWRAGLLRPLQAELGNARDVLSCSAALELVAELAEGARSGNGAGAGSAAAAALGAVLEPQLRALLGAHDTFLQCQALRVRLQFCFTSVYCQALLAAPLSLLCLMLSLDSSEAGLHHCWG